MSALWALNNGISYRFEEDDFKEYQKQIPSGSKLGAVNTICGRTIVYNQYADINDVMVLWADDSKFSKNIQELSNHKLYIMNKCVVTKILHDDRETYHKRLILFNENDEGVVNVGNTIIKKADMAVGKVFRNASIVQAPSTLKTIRLYNIGDDELGLTVECDSWVNVIDLTQMFGSGNEPTTTAEFEAMFPNDYYPYSEGTLLSMGTSEVLNVGKNILKCKNFSCSSFDKGYNPSLSNGYGTSIDSIEPSNKVIVTQSKVGQTDNGMSYTNGYFCIGFNPFILNDNYVFSFDVMPTKLMISSIDVGLLMNGDNPIRPVNTQDLQVGKTTKLYFSLEKNDKKITYFEIRNSGISGTFENFQIEKGTTNTTYSPYHEATYQIPQAIRDLEGYGWGVNNVYNYVDYENKKFIKYVGRLQLSGDQYAIYQDAENPFCYNDREIPNLKINSDNFTFNILSTCNIKSVFTKNGLTRFYYPKGTVLNEEGKPHGYLYYELAEPVVTDISDIIGDTFQEPFNVEVGGSLTFKNVNGDGHKLAVPSNIQYVVSLKEVTS